MTEHRGVWWRRGGFEPPTSPFAKRVLYPNELAPHIVNDRIDRLTGASELFHFYHRKVASLKLGHHPNELDVHSVNGIAFTRRTRARSRRCVE